MSLSFTCPSCKAHMEVPDELSGQSGQCPRCQHVFTIPSPKAPPMTPVGRAVPGAPTKVPPFDPWAKDERDDGPPRSRGDNRPRRARVTATQPSGPAWPWLVGVAGALVIGGLLFSAFLVLVSWRKFNPNDARAAIKQTQQQSPVFGNQRITAGKFDGQRGFLVGGVFQVKSELNNNDQNDPNPNHFGCKRKRYEVEVFAFRDYFVDLDSNQFDPRVRIEGLNMPVNEAGWQGQRNLSMQFRPHQNGFVTIYASSAFQANGPFTLTVRELHQIKPNIP